MTSEDFADRVLTSMPDIDDPRDNEAVWQGARTLFHDGFTVSEAIAFSLLLEEVNPDLDEKFALQEMGRIRAVVAKRKELT